MPDKLKVDEGDLRALSVDDSLEMAVKKFPLKYVLKALIKRHGLEKVKEAVAEMAPKQ